MESERSPRPVSGIIVNWRKNIFLLSSASAMLSDFCTHHGWPMVKMMMKIEDEDGAAVDDEDVSG
jgi:hypothetical protein